MPRRTRGYSIKLRAQRLGEYILIFVHNHVDVLGVRICCVEIDDVVAMVSSTISSNDHLYIAVTGMHGVMESGRDAHVLKAHLSAGLAVPDGMPLVWACHFIGERASRVYGPELLDRLLRESVDHSWASYFYGGDHDVVDRFIAARRISTPTIKIVGSQSPPFRDLSSDERAEAIEVINRAAPDIVWVVLGTPKQERWMLEHQNLLNAPILIGIGAGVGLLSGDVRQAPPFMRKHGFEWLFRLLMEPRRLWRRYLVLGSQFVLKISMRRPVRWEGDPCASLLLCDKATLSESTTTPRAQ